MKRSIVALSLLTALSVPAVADDHQPWYLGFGLGMSDWQGVCPDNGDCDDEDFAFDIFGGYRFNDVVGVELGYFDLGETDWRDTLNQTRSHQAKGARLGLVGLLPLNDEFSLAAELGVNYYDADIKLQRVSGSDSDNDNGFQPYIGAGFNYAINQAFEVGFRWRHFREMETNDAQFNRTSTHYWGLNFSYHFGRAPAPVIAPEPEPVIEEVIIVEQVVEQVVEVAPSTVLYFDTNSAEVSGAELQKLTDIGRYMNAYPQVRAELVGHTDASGNPEYNRILGEKRARAVQQELLIQHGISADRVVIESTGEQGATAQRSRNERRVTVNLFEME
ncbi:OmpA family protein [Ferrimonas senticii]|uniref:OmpA family protein n=1 Tax=Ferrimonas senticii TaxID=394566 RepID=UPI00146BFEED|nr:OmpA family protein [Ferrimonas senticii]